MDGLAGPTGPAPEAEVHRLTYMDYYKPGETPYCVYSESLTCFKKLTPEEKGKRFDGIDYLHTCPQGRALDRCCNECSEACYNADAKRKPPEPPYPFGGYF